MFLGTRTVVASKAAWCNTIFFGGINRKHGIEEKPQIKAASDPHRSKIWKCVPTMDHPWIKATIFLLKKSSSQNKPLQLVI